MTSIKDQIKAMNQTMLYQTNGAKKNAKENATNLFKDIQGANEVIEVEDRKALYLLNCSDCTYTIKNKPIKISIENCKNLKLHVEAKVLTGMVEIWKSEKLDIEFERSVSSFQLDSIKGLRMKLPDAEHFGTMVWAGVDNLVIELGDDKHELSYEALQQKNPALRPEVDQFKTTVVGDSLMTEAIIRMLDGYPATAREEAAVKALEKKKDAVLRAGLDGANGDDEDDTA